MDGDGFVVFFGILLGITLLPLNLLLFGLLAVLLSWIQRRITLLIAAAVGMLLALKLIADFAQVPGDLRFSAIVLVMLLLPAAALLAGYSLTRAPRRSLKTTLLVIFAGLAIAILSVPADLLLNAEPPPANTADIDVEILPPEPITDNAAPDDMPKLNTGATAAPREESRTHDDRSTKAGDIVVEIAPPPTAEAAAAGSMVEAGEAVGAPISIDLVPDRQPLSSAQVTMHQSLPASPEMTYVWTVFATPDGDLWVGDVSGPVRYHDASWTVYDAFQGELPLTSFTMAANGDVLGAGCAGVFRFDGQAWQPIVDMWQQETDNPVMDWCVSAITAAPDASLWVTQADLAQVNGHGVIHLTESSHTWYGKASESETKPAFAIIPWPPSGAWVQAVVSWREYPILVAVEDNLVSFDGAAWRIMPEQPATGLPSILSLTVGPDDALWLGTSAGLMRFDGSEWITYRFLPAADAVESIAVGDIAFDAVGTAWMVSTAGIVRFDGQRAVVYTLEMPELLSIYAGRIAVGEQGSLWLAAHGHGLVEVALPEAP